MESNKQLNWFPYSLSTIEYPSCIKTNYRRLLDDWNDHILKQTPTQRHFKAEMARAKKKHQLDPTPYEQNLYRIKTPTEKPQRWLSTALIVVIAILLMATWSTLRGGQYSDNAKISPLPAAALSNPEENVVSHTDAVFLQSLQTQQEQVDAAMEPINTFHQTPQKERNQQQYQQALLQGIAVCQQAELAVLNIHSPDQFKPFTQLTLEYIENTNKALNYYLESGSSTDPSMVQQGNTFLNIAAGKRSTYMQALESYLKTNGYKYEQTMNGLQYWYSK